MYKTAYNTTDSPVVVDEEGRVLGGREWGTVDDTFEGVKRGAAEGRLHVFHQRFDEGPGQNPDAIAAQQRTAELEERRKVVAELPAERVRELLGEDDAGLDLNDARRRVAASDLDLKASDETPTTEETQTEAPAKRRARSAAEEG